MTPTDILLAALSAVGITPRQLPTGWWRHRCPSHDDKIASGGFKDDDGGVGIKCHAGCTRADILAAIDVSERELTGRDPDELFTKGPAVRLGHVDRPAPEPEPSADETIVMPIPASVPRPGPSILEWNHERPTRIWWYRDAAGNPLLAAVRWDWMGQKRFRHITLHRSRDGSGYIWKLGGLPSVRPLYGLEVLALRPGDHVGLTEGEKACHAARELFPQYVWLSWCGGASAAGCADLTPLAGRAVTLWPDADPPGAAAAVTLAVLMPSLLVVDVAGFPLKWDLADECPAGMSLAGLLAHAVPMEVAAQHLHHVAPLPNISDDGCATLLFEVLTYSPRHAESHGLWNRGLLVDALQASGFVRAAWHDSASMSSDEWREKWASMNADWLKVQA